MKKTFIDIVFGFVLCMILIALVLFAQGRDTGFIYSNF